LMVLVSSSRVVMTEPPSLDENGLYSLSSFA
jgi:hypothetical protein